VPQIAPDGGSAKQVMQEPGCRPDGPGIPDAGSVMMGLDLQPDTTGGELQWGAGMRAAAPATGLAYSAHSFETRPAALRVRTTTAPFNRALL
jgi:hypothetical protein